MFLGLRRKILKYDNAKSDKTDVNLAGCQDQSSMNCTLMSVIYIHIYVYIFKQSTFLMKFNDNIGETMGDLLFLVTVIAFDLANTMSADCIQLSMSSANHDLTLLYVLLIFKP